MKASLEEQTEAEEAPAVLIDAAHEPKTAT